jgi:GntR family transcriptional regulator/MocR family aminotransferase
MLHLTLDENSSKPLFRQVADGIVKLVISGALADGAPLPSTRQLSEDTGLSRDTINRAYEELSYQGIVVIKPGRGTFVHYKRAVESAEPDGACSDIGRLSAYAARITTSDEVEAGYAEIFAEFNYSAPAASELPLKKWRETLIDCCSSKRFLSRCSYVTDEFGHEGLRRAIADFLTRSRGIIVDWQQVVIFSGTQPTLDLIARLFLDAGDLAVVEDPGFPGARRTFTSLGAKIAAIPIDDHGLKVKEFAALPVVPKLLYLTPAYHDPTGVVLSDDRRKALAAWAQAKDVLVIEDDFDSALHYGKSAVPPLQPLATNQVIFLYGFWKVMFPVIRIGCAVIPWRLISLFRRAKSLVERDFDFIEHEALAQFLQERHLDRHVAQLRRLYAARRERLITLLNENLTGCISVSGANAGTHLVVQFADDFKESFILDAAEKTGLPIVSMEKYCWKVEAGGKFFVPFSHLSDDQLSQSARAFGLVISEARKS